MSLADTVSNGHHNNSRKTDVPVGRPLRSALYAIQKGIDVTPEQRERYVRWQDYRVSQLSFSINLFLGFSVASLAYVINLLLTSARSNSALECVLMIWAFSAGAGCIATVSRLLDFRYTALKIKSPNGCNTFIAAHLGKVTWVMFWVQIILYPYGAYYFIHNYVLANSI